MIIFFNTVLICFFYYIIGQSHSSLKSGFSNYCILIINGSIILSFIALLSNFFLSLDILFNSLMFIGLIFYGFYKKSYKIIFNKTNIKALILISLFATILIFLSNSNRPDSGLYHFPFIKLLNDEKIIIGITNINSRFGSISIIQYLQAISNNYITMTNGMLLPLSILPSVIYLYFISEIKNQLRKKTTINKIYLLYLFFTIIFCSYKMNRYSEYGNDYIPHFLVFFLLSLLLKYKKKIEFSNIYFYTIFIFLNKITFLSIFLIPLIILKLNFNKKVFLNRKTFFASFFLILWIIKNILTSGCMFWPINKSCVEKLSWFNKDKNSTHYVQNVNNITQAWVKAWPDRTNNNGTIESYINGYGWVKVWFKKHAKKILNILGVYILILAIISFFLSSNSKSKLLRIQNSIKTKYWVILISIFTLSSLIWFLKFPIYRLGISSLVLIIILIFIIINRNIALNEKNINLIKYLSLICILIFISKNMIKFNKYNINYNNHPWPKYYSFNNKNDGISLMKIKINNKFSHYKVNSLCMYSKSPCTNENISKLLKMKKKFSYKVYYF